MATCSACSTENPAGARFCMSCGTPLERRCVSCGEPLPEGARFCMSCGTPVEGPQRTSADPTPAHSEEVPAATPTLDERRTVTVLFADLSGYTAVAERLDPESVKRQLERILGRLGEEVVNYGGHIDKFIGDNVMAIFGAPVAHGDDAVRAVRAGLAMQDAMDELNAPLTAQDDVTFQLCVGINTGEVLAGQVGESYTVIGDTVYRRQPGRGA
jgi:adenylate cyclase